jgi:hypothetical protein
MKSIEIPDELAEQVVASGADLASFVVTAVQQRLAASGGKTLADRIEEGWVPPVVQGKVRSDGVAWSEIESPCDPA